MRAESNKSFLVICINHIHGHVNLTNEANLSVRPIISEEKLLRIFTGIYKPAAINAKTWVTSYLQTFLGEGSAGMGFKVFLKCSCLLRRAKCDSCFYPPRSMLCCVRTGTLVVFV
jgi:hypothetical protein